MVFESIPMPILTGLTGGVGAVGYIVRKFVDNALEAEATDEVEVFSWKLALLTGLPVVAAGIAAGYTMTPVSFSDWIAIAFAGAGAAYTAGRALKFFNVKK